MRGVVLAALLSAAAAGGLRAQEVRLDDVDGLAAQGRTEEARDLLVRWWSGPRTGASRQDLQRGLWLRARLTVDPAEAELDFRRLLVEYPGGPWSDRALLRLAQAAHARGDGERAQALVAELARDYPSTSARRDAEAWIASAGPAPDPPSTATASGPDAAPPASSVAPAPASRAGGFAVQLGAFSSEGRARTLADRLAAAGYEPRLVRVDGSDLVRVRVGRFASSSRADALAASLRGAGFTAMAVADADLERQVRP